MIRTLAWLSVTALFSALPVGAQTFVRLQVATESWLGSTPLDVRAEVLARLHDANIEVTEAADAPLVSVWYEEEQANLQWPYLIPGTRISFETAITTKDGLSTHTSSNITGRARTNNEIVSAPALRQDAIDAFKLSPAVIMFGYQVGALLGLASSFEVLLARDKSPTWDFWVSMIFMRLAWSNETDDLFARVIERPVPISSGTQSQYVIRTMNDFLRRNLQVLQSSASAGMRAPLSAIGLIEEYGNEESVPILKELIAHPILGEPAKAAVQQIEKRVAANPK